MRHRNWTEQGPAKPFHPSDLDPQQAKVDQALRESLARVEAKLDAIFREMRSRQPVPGVYGPDQHGAGFVAKEVG